MQETFRNLTSLIQIPLSPSTAFDRNARESCPHFSKTVAHQSSFFLLKIIKKLTIWLTIKDGKSNWWSTVMQNLSPKHIFMFSFFR
jgi:hypothetical protein